MRYRLSFLLLILAPIATGCQSGTPAGDSPSPAPTAAAGARPAAYIDGATVTRDDLYGLLVEARGGAVLSELLLDRAIARRLAEQGQALTDADLDAEHQQLIDSLSADADQATRLLGEMRARRGLGELRFAALLRRNAGLRRLVHDETTVAEPAIRQAYELRYGRQYRVRLITAGAVETLSTVRRRVLAGESFTDLAIAVSTDPSAGQGGLLSPISPADATYPKAVRDALPGLSMGDTAGRLSPVLAMPDGYALLWLEGVIEPEGPPIEQVRDELARGLRLELERVRMQQLARVLIEQANVIVLDPALDASWQRLRGQIADR